MKYVHCGGCCQEVVVIIVVVVVVVVVVFSRRGHKWKKVRFLTNNGSSNKDLV